MLILSCGRVTPYSDRNLKEESPKWPSICSSNPSAQPSSPPPQPLQTPYSWPLSLAQTHLRLSSSLPRTSSNLRTVTASIEGPDLDLRPQWSARGLKHP